MKTSFLFFVFVLGLLFLPQVILAQDSLNAGFVKGIWYSERPFFEGDQIRIYAAIQNRSGFDIIGQVNFYDNSDLIGSADFSALNGRLIEVWADWTAQQGRHVIYAEITEAKKSEIGQELELITLDSIFSSEDILFIDFDTDRDSIGNQDDPDDDNDGLLDIEDPDPLKKNEPEQISRQGQENQAANNLVLNQETPDKDFQDKVSQVYQKTKEKALPAAKTIISKLNDFTDQQAEVLQEKTKQAKQEIETLKEQEPGKSRTLKNIQFYTLSFISFFFSHKILLFTAVIIILYLIFRFIFKKI